MENPNAAAPLLVQLIFRQPKVLVSPLNANVKVRRRVVYGLVSSEKQKRRKQEGFKDAADEADKKSWRRLMNLIEETGSAVSVVRSERTRGQPHPNDLVWATSVGLKQLKKWNVVSEIHEWLRTRNWWDFSEMDFLILIKAYGKQRDFNKAKKV